MKAGAVAWQDALLAIRAFAMAPHGLGGIRLRARAGPVRERWLVALREAIGDDLPIRKLPANIAPDRLIGGIDLAATLGAGTTVAQGGLLAEADGGVLIVPMAERMAPHVAAALIAALDTGMVTVERDGLSRTAPARVALVLLDEGGDSDEAPPAALIERMGMSCALDDVSIRDLETSAVGVASQPVDDPTTTLCEIASLFAIDSARAPIFALACARALAQADGREEVGERELEAATRLVLLPRATAMPSVEGEAEPEPPPPGGTTLESGTLADRIVEASAASLPGDVLAAIDGKNASSRTRQAGHGAGALRKSLQRGRPVGSRPGKPGAGARLHLIDTLRAAAPWQRLRRGPGQEVQIRREDFRVRRFAERSEATLIVLVDASGSAAAERMAEAKGAVELLLAQAYVRRTQVALIAFRGEGAEVLLPPTRSLVRAKRELSQMAGGGGTPLAAGIEAGQVLAEGERGRGRTPFVVVMTDGRGNIARDGRAGREQADADARMAGRRFAAAGLKCVVIDIAARPRNDGRDLARAMSGDYVALPRADATATRDIVAALSQ